MTLMKGGKQPLGYTIVEVLIVLAVSGVMFVIAASFVSGKQARASFQQGTRTLTATIQSSIEAVIDGQYTDVPLTCSVLAAPRSLHFSAGSSATQGTNSDCTFLGQLLHFNVTDSTIGSAPTSNYEVVTLAAAKFGSSSTTLTSLSDSALTTVTPEHGAVNLSRKQRVPQNLTVEGMKVFFVGPLGSIIPKPDIYDIGFVQGLGSTDGTLPTSYASGAQSISLIADDTIGAGKLPSDLGNHLSQSTAKPVSKAVICITDGDRHASITIGGNSNQLSAILKTENDGLACT